MLAQRGLGAHGVFRGLVRMGHGDTGAVAVGVGGAERKAVGRGDKAQVHGDQAFGTLLLEQPLPGHAAVAADGGIAPQAREHRGGLARCDGGLHAPQPTRQMAGYVHRHALQIDPGERVAVVQAQIRRRELDVLVLRRNLGDLADGDAGVLGRVEGADIDLAAVDEVVGAARL